MSQSSPQLPAKAKRPKHTPAKASPLEPEVINIPAATDHSADPEAVPALTEMDAAAGPDAMPALSAMEDEADPNAMPALCALDAAESPLTQPQRIALVALAAGMSQIEAANEAGVSRMTLHRWLRQDADVQAVYNAWQQDALATAQNQGATTPPRPGISDAEELRRTQTLARKKQRCGERSELQLIEMEESLQGLGAKPDGK